MVPTVVPIFGSGTTLAGDSDAKGLTTLHDWFPRWFPNSAREPVAQDTKNVKTSGTTGNHLGEPLVQACFRPLKPDAHVLTRRDTRHAICHAIEGYGWPGLD